MKISAQEEYGLRCALQLARVAPDGSLTLQEIADREGLSPAYVAKLLNLLRQGDLVQSVRGRLGGYTLGRPVERISVADVLGTLGGQLWEPSGCERFTGSLAACVRSPGCTIRSLWSTVDALVDGLLRSVTLADLLTGDLRGAAPFLPAIAKPGAGDAGPQPRGIGEELQETSREPT